ncbi:MAG TPA: GNAT family N-acetyltransferase [Kofleriaceae bacterium]|jgi:RimJ/RimL family protein N-acetyltransferase
MITVETPRLVLRPHVPSDLEQLIATWADPDVYRFLAGRPFTREECWARLLRHVGHWTVFGWGMFAVLDRASGRYIGDVGFANFERGIVGIDGSPEAGWLVAGSVQGKGLASEALAAATAWLDEKIDPPRTVCMIDLGNAASHKVAAKAGYRESGRAKHGESDVMLYARVRR